jgi:hypothetical protein
MVSTRAKSVTRRFSGALRPCYASGFALISREEPVISVPPCLCSVVLVHPPPSLLGCDVSGDRVSWRMVV